MTGQFDRRMVLQGALAGTFGALIPFPEWLGRYGTAQAQAPLIRYGLHTPQGQVMLSDYRNAVAAMSAKPAHEPCSWIFQWYLHEVRSDIGKADAVASLPNTAQPLANEVWGTCQAHGGRPPGFFLPWHRMYAYFFERIIRAASGNPNFTLPYWNYLPLGQRKLPEPFRLPTTDPLFRPDRWPAVNNGVRIDDGDPFTILADCLNETTYHPTIGHDGFNEAVKNNPHNSVHGAIGSLVGMGRVPWAANDPIFWMHHCNIDRMWASWNAAGRTNPNNAAWLDQQFVFADEHCNRVLVKVSDFITTEALGYRYDELVPVIRPGIIEQLRRVRLIAHWPPPIPGPDPAARQIRLGRQPVTVPLRSAVRGPAFMTQTLSTARTVRLALTNLQTDRAPGVFYRVFLGAPAAAGRRARRIQVGTITFFDAERGGEHAHARDSGWLPSYHFDVTRAVRALPRGAALEVTIAPRGRPAAEATPVIGNVQLFAG